VLNVRIKHTQFESFSKNLFIAVVLPHSEIKRSSLAFTMEQICETHSRPCGNGSERAVSCEMSGLLSAQFLWAKSGTFRHRPLSVWRRERPIEKSTQFCPHRKKHRRICARIKCSEADIEPLLSEQCPFKEPMELTTGHTMLTRTVLDEA
jgi:hypothetical protein